MNMPDLEAPSNVPHTPNMVPVPGVHAGPESVSIHLFHPLAVQQTVHSPPVLVLFVLPASGGASRGLFRESGGSRSMGTPLWVPFCWMGAAAIMLVGCSRLRAQGGGGTLGVGGGVTGWSRRGVRGYPTTCTASTAKGEPPGAPPKNTDTAIQRKKGNRQRRAAKNK